MSTNFVMNDTNANGSAIAALCSGNSNNSGDQDSCQCEIDGTAGSTERACNIDASGSQLNCYWMELDNIDDYDGASGTWNVPFEFSTGNHNVTLEEVWICHVDSGYSVKNTLGSETGIGFNTNGGATTRNITQGSSVSIAAGDKIIIIAAFSNSKSSVQGFGITPQDTVVGPGSVTADTSDQEFAATSPVLSLPSVLSLILPVAVAVASGSTDPTFAAVQQFEVGSVPVGPTLLIDQYRLQYQTQTRPIDFTTAAEEVTVDKWYQDLSHDIAFRVKKIAERLFAGASDPELLTQPEATTPDKWFVSFSEPVRSLEPLVPEGTHVVDTKFLPEPSVDKWSPSLYEPRRDPFLYPQGGIEYVGDIIIEDTQLDEWYRALSEPVRTLLPIVPEGAYLVDPDLLTQPEAVSIDKWLQPLETVRIDPTTYPLGGVEYVGEPIVPAESDWFPDKWYQQLSEPVQVAAPLVPEGQITSDPELLTQPEAVSIDKWLQTLSTPRIDPFLHPIGGVEYVGEPIIAAEEITLDKWYQALSGPVLPLPVVEGIFCVDADALTQPEAVSIDKWLQPLSLPRIDPALHPYGGLVYVGELITPPSIAPAGSPLFHKRFQYQISSYVPVGEQIPAESNAGNVLHHNRFQYQTYALPPHIVEEGPGPAALEWFIQLSEPVRYLVGSDSFRQPWYHTAQRDLFYVGEPISPTGPGAEGIEWLVHYPDRPPEAEAVAYQQETTEFAAIVMPMDAWYKPLSEPVISAPVLNASGFFAIDFNILTIGEDITLDKWFASLSERPLQILRATDYTVFVSDPTSLIQVETITLDKWFAPLSNPVRLIEHPIPLSDFWPGLVEQCFDTGWRNFGSFANVVVAGSEVSWTSPGNAQDEDGSFASAGIMDPGFDSDYLAATDMQGPPIPDGVVIIGIQIRFVGDQNGDSNTNFKYRNVQLTKNGTTFVGDNEAFNGAAQRTWATSTASPHIFPLASDDLLTFFPEDDLWQLTWTVAEVNAAGFGVGFTAEHIGVDGTFTARADQIQVKVFYCLPSFAETITADKWFQQLSLPPARRILPASAVQTLIYEPKPILEIITIDKWFAQLSRLAPGLPPLPVGARQSFITDPASLLEVETITVDKWFQALSYRPLGRPIVPAALAVSGANVYVTTLPPPLPIDTWFNLLSEPVRILPPLPRGAMQWLAVDPTALTLPEQVTVHKWILEPCPDGGWTIVGKPVPGWTKDGKPSPGWSKEC